MKIRIYMIICIISMLFGVSGCATHIKVHSKPKKLKTVPPGQAKKMTGSKSAKPFAPGQNK